MYPVPNPDLRPPVSLCIGELYNLFVRCTASTAKRGNLTQPAGPLPTHCALCLGADRSNNCRCLFFLFLFLFYRIIHHPPRRCKCRCHHQTCCVTGFACVGFARKAKHCPPVVSATRPCHTTADQSRSRQQPKCNATCNMHTPHSLTYSHSHFKIFSLPP